MGARSNAARSGLGTFLATLGGELSDIRKDRRQADRVRSEGDASSRRRMGEMTLRQALEEADPRNKASQLLTQQQTSESAARTAEIPRTGRNNQAIAGANALRAETGAVNAETSAATEARIGETAEDARKKAARKLTAAETKTEKVKAWTELRDADPTKIWEIFIAADEDVVDSAVFKVWALTFRKDINALGGGGAGDGSTLPKIGDTGQGGANAPSALPAAPAQGGGQMIGDTTTTAGAQEVFGRGGTPQAGPVTMGLAQRAVDAGMADTVDAAITELKRRGADISK